MIIFKIICTIFISVTILVVIVFFLRTLLSNGFDSSEMKFYAGYINFDEFVNRLVRKDLIIFILNLSSFITIYLLLSKDKTKYILLTILLMLFIININPIIYLLKHTNIEQEINVFGYLVRFYIFPMIIFFFLLFLCFILKRKQAKG